MEDTRFLLGILALDVLCERLQYGRVAKHNGYSEKKNSVGSLYAAYHIDDRDERPDDGDDEEGTRSYPSRTTWGAAYSLAEKFPFLFERRFGVRAYDYWNGYTIAQINLMVADQPLVVYPKNKEAKPTKKKMDDAYERWAARKKGEQSMLGKEVSLKDFLK